MQGSFLVPSATGPWMNDGYYVYAILSAGTPVPAELRGFGDHPLESISYRELAAVVSVVNSSEPQATVEAVLEHEQVVERLRESFPLLPVRFGTKFARVDSLVAALERQHDALLRDLRRLGDKVEYGLTVIWHEPAGQEETIAPTDDQIAHPGIQSAAPGPGTRYLQARVNEHRNESARRAIAQELSHLLETDFAPFSLESRRTIQPTPGIAIRAAYLLHPTTSEALFEAFELSRKRHPEFRFLLNGPWPPYSFVSTSGPDREAISTGQSRKTDLDVQEEVTHGYSEG